MMRLYVVVEGQTEEEFVKRVLEPHLRAHKLWTYPITVGGGDWTNWRRTFKALRGEHKGPDVRFTTMFDLYGLPRNFPGFKEHCSINDTKERAKRLESAMVAELGDERLIPYLQRHEFETLVLVGLEVLKTLLDPEDRPGLEDLRTLVETVAPEDVNDGESTAPSKRLEACIPVYKKTVHGPLVVEAIGIEALRAACPRFDAWVTRLEQLAAGAAA